MIGLLTLILLFPAAIVGGSRTEGSDGTYLSRSFTFSSPRIEQCIVDNTVFHQVTIPDAPGAWNVGEPDLPAYGVSFLLPAGTTVEAVTVEPGSEISLGAGFNVAPVIQPVKLSDLPNTALHILKNETIYLSESVFPTTQFSVIGTYGFRGYSILVVLLYPVRYLPVSGGLSYFTELSVHITTKKAEGMNRLYRGVEEDRREIEKKVDCLDSLASYADILAAPRSATGYDLLILTTDELKEGFSALKDAHEAQGMKTEIKTLTDVSIFPSQVTPESIRDFIRKTYIDEGIEYVLIGGDANVVPAQMLWVLAGQETTTMPSDLFYACLDGTYNFNGNEKWGETRDGDGGSDVDLVAEVYVGRAPVDDLTETENFVQKTIAYMNTGGYGNGTSLMAGEYLWGPPDYPVTFGDTYMDELINRSTANQYTTNGIPPSEYTFEKLYDQDWPGFDPEDPWHTGWSTSDIMERINNGVMFVNHLGHSSSQYNMRMVSSDVLKLTNTILPFIYSQGCNAGSFDDDDCIAEAFTVKTTHAAFAVIMCARYGWGSPGSTNGPSQRYHRYFWDAVFGEDITAIGKANQDSKEENLKKITGQCMRWCYYEMNLFGDPTLTFFPVSSNVPPQKPSKPTGTASGQVGNSYNYTAVATDSDNDTLFYKWSFGDGTCSSWLGPYESGEQVSITHNWSKWGLYEVKVKARDEHRTESDWSDPLPVKMPLIPQYRLIDRIIEFLQQYFPVLSMMLNL
jgi:hypothetical protein